VNRANPENRTRLSWWFPKLPPHIPTPETIIIPYTGIDLTYILDKQIPPHFARLCVEIENAGELLGWPLFLRTDYLSGKHNWKDTCHVPNPESVAKRVTRLVEESAMADMMGFPTDQWIARKLIPTKPAFHAFHGHMPIVKERRYFVQDDQVVCHHPYWPSEAFIDKQISITHWPHHLFAMNVEPDYEVRWLSKFSSEVGAALGGAWSIDWLWSEEERMWYLTDMADAEQSYHWPECRIKEVKL